MRRINYGRTSIAVRFSSAMLCSELTPAVSVGIQKINKQEVALLPNRTDPIAGDEDHGVIILHVFHQLHCLVNV